MLPFLRVGWLGPKNDQLRVAMDTFGRLPRLLHNNLHTLSLSWQIGQKSSSFLYTNAECSWDYSIVLTFSHILFQLGRGDTKIVIICLVHSFDTFSIVTLRGCLVGVPDVKKAVTMDSQHSFTPTCGRPSFRDVVACASKPRNVQESTPAVYVRGYLQEIQPPILHPVVHTTVPTPVQEPMHTAIADSVRGRERKDKENVKQAQGDLVLSVKPKRKYIRKQKPAAAPDLANVVPTKGMDEVGSPPSTKVLRPSSPRRKRKYTRKVAATTSAISPSSEISPAPTSQGGACGDSKSTGRGSPGRRSLPAAHCVETSTDEGSPEVLPISPNSFTPPLTRARSEFPCRVCVLLRDLLWGGEMLPVSCPFAIGTVLGAVESIGGDESRVGDHILQVDFGTYLGVQSLPLTACHMLQPKNVIERGGCDFEDDTAKATEGIDCLDRMHDVAMAGWEQADSDSAHDWDPALSDLGSEDNAFSSGASSIDLRKDDPMVLLAELGVYPVGPEPERPELEHKYADQNWHAKTWTLLPRQPFVGKTPGPTEHIPFEILLQPIEYFLLFWDETLQRKLVRESNDYADYVDPTTGKRKGGTPAAKSITLEEFRQFTGICCLMGVKGQPSIRDYWCRGQGALFCPDVAGTMSRWRFEYILRCLHMTSRQNFVTDKESPEYDPIGKCRWIFEHVEARFQQFWNLSPYVTVDECMVAYNGRFCSFKQYLPAKPISHGIKIWAMACSVTSYVYRFEIYVGKHNTQSGDPTAAHIGMAGQVVARLTKGLEGQWYTVTCDNYFTSPYLFDDLLSRGFYAIGTARKQRKGFPASLCIIQEEPRGTLHMRVHKDMKMAAIHWQDTKGVYFLATAADPMVRGGVVTNRISGQRITEVPTSPIQLLYSKMMGGVDVGDQNRSYYSTQIATKKWWHRVYFFCLDSCIANAFTIHKEMSKRLGEKPLSHKEFQLQVSYALMGRPYQAGGATLHVQTVGRSPRRPCDGFSTHVPRKSNLRRVCRICKRRTRWICAQCDGIRLCTATCFEFFHNRPSRV